MWGEAGIGGRLSCAQQEAWATLLGVVMAGLVKKGISRSPTAFVEDATC